MLKIILLLRNLQTSWANNLKILKIKSAEFSGYCFYMNTTGEFEICISVPLRGGSQFSECESRYCKIRHLSMRNISCYTIPLFLLLSRD